MNESFVGENAVIGDVVCLIDRSTQLPVSSEFVVLGIAYRPGPNESTKKYLYLSDGNGAYMAEEVRVVETKKNSQEIESE